MVVNVYRAADGGFLVSPGIMYLPREHMVGNGQAQLIGTLDCDDLPRQDGTAITHAVCKQQYVYIPEGRAKTLELETKLEPTNSGDGP